MKTYAPSLTKSLAVANPIPSVPPVTTAILPSSFLGINLLRCDWGVTNFPRSASFDVGRTRVPKASSHRRLGYSLPLSNGLRLTQGTPRHRQHLPACRFASVLALQAPPRGLPP